MEVEVVYRDSDFHAGDWGSVPSTDLQLTLAF